MTKRRKILTRIVSFTMAVMLTTSVAWSGPVQAMEPFGCIFGGTYPEDWPP